MNIKKVFKFILIVFGPLILGFITSKLFTTGSYEVINKPFLSPNKILFPIVWSILYLLMGISLYIALNEEFNLKTIIIFSVQLAINLIWPFIFFELTWYVLSALWIILLIYFVILMIVDFYNIKKSAGYLQIPYFIWLLFALYLNIGVAILN